MEPTRISAQETKVKVDLGTALLVCAYDDNEKFKKMSLQGAISYDEFKSKLPTISKEFEIIFY